MAHPARGRLVTDLQRRLDRPVGVVWDEIGDRHDTGIRAVAAYDPACTHHLVLQDDALPCRYLLASIEQAMDFVPDGHPASFYIGAVRPFSGAIRETLAGAGRVSWLRFPGPWWGPAVVLPTETIPRILEWWDTPQAKRTQGFDMRLARWFNVDCWYSWPSLVDHRGDDSLVYGRTSRRHAMRPVGPQRSGLGIRWDGEVVKLRHARRLDAERQRRAREAGVRR